MRIGIDASAMLVRSAGVKNYVWNWSRALVESDVDLYLYPFLRRDLSLNHERSPLSALATTLRLGLLHAGHLLGSVVDWTAPACDVFHASNQMIHWPKRAKLTATLHDFTCWRLPELHTRGNIGADRNYADHILRRADGLIAVSESTRRDAIELLGIRPERVTTILSGVDERFFDAPPLVRKKPYALYVGTIEPRKNVETLLDAWNTLDAGLRETYDLVIAGPMGWASAETQHRVRTEAQYLGYVEEAELPALTAGACVFVYPSLYEGFGFPVAQAMAAGVPVITSNVSSLPEVMGSGGILVEPKSVAQLSTALIRLLEDSEHRRLLAKRAREEAERFHWSRCASDSVAFFERTISF
ncbi:MAG: glycosyltransferase family 1 protein [Bryobacteraceae bacterium]